MHNRRMCRVGVVEPYGWSPWGGLSAILRVGGPFLRRVIGGVSLYSFQIVGCAELSVDEVGSDEVGEVGQLGDRGSHEVTKSRNHQSTFG